MKKTILAAVMLLIGANVYCELPLQYWTLLGKSAVPVTYRDKQIKENITNTFTQEEKELLDSPTFNALLTEINKIDPSLFNSETKQNLDVVSDAYKEDTIKTASYLEALFKEFSSQNSAIPQDLQSDTSFQAFRNGFLSSYNHPIIKKYFQNWWKF